MCRTIHIYMKNIAEARNEAKWKKKRKKISKTILLFSHFGKLQKSDKQTSNEWQENSQQKQYMHEIFAYTTITIPSEARFQCCCTIWPNNAKLQLTSTMTILNYIYGNIDRSKFEPHPHLHFHT